MVFVSAPLNNKLQVTTYKQFPISSSMVVIFTCYLFILCLLVSLIVNRVDSKQQLQLQ